MELTAVVGTRPSTLNTIAAVAPRSTYNAKESENPAGGYGELARKDDQAPVGDKAIDAAHDNAGIVHDFYEQVLGRNSLDNKGMELKSVVHYGKAYNNAYWDGEKMTYGDGDGKLFSPLSGALDVVAHEMAHGVTEHTAALAYRGQSGALNESWSDVFGELIEQWSENKSGFGTLDAAKGADWLIGEDVFTPGVAGDALRSMKAPGTAYKGDPQPAHMKDYKKMSGDNGGVHYNSGIPNKAAYEAALLVGGDKVAKIWYSALTTYLKPNASFADAAGATIAAATKLYGAGEVTQAITNAWTGVGITAAPAAPITAPPRHTPERHSVGSDDGIVPPWLRAKAVQV